MSLVALLFGSLTTAHAVPVQLNQQGRLLDVSGAGVTGIQTMTFKLFDAQFGGNALWQDNVQVAFDNGYYATLIGGNPSNLLDDSVLSTGAPIYLEMEINGGGPIGARQEVVSAPYARRAAVAAEVDGGPVDATQISVDGQLVIDATGSWVGPAVAVNWSDIANIPADLADGDDDALGGLSCATGQIAGWNGSAWACADDNGLTESEVVAFVENAPVNLAAGSSMGGYDLLTTADQGESLADLSCQTGDLPKYDAVLGWQCGVDNDTSDWNALANVPGGFADGIDNDTSDWNALANVPAGFADGIDNDTSDWNSLANVPAGFADGVDNALTDSEVDAYVENGALNLAAGTMVGGQNIMTSTACSHGEVLSYDANLGDWACTSFQTLLDADGDGAMGWNDCDDADPNVADPNGLSADCASASCLDILNDGHSNGTGIYWLSGNGGAYQAYCEMDAYGGGWTLAMKATGTLLQYDSAYWTDGNLLNETSLDESNQNAKFESFLSIEGTELMLKSEVGNTTHLGLQSQDTLSDVFNATTTLLTHLGGSDRPSRLINNNTYSHCGHTWRTNTHSLSRNAYIRLGGWVNSTWNCSYGSDHAGQPTGAHLLGFGLLDNEWGSFTYNAKSFGVRDAHDQNNLNPGQLESFGMIFVR